MHAKLRRKDDDNTRVGKWSGSYDSNLGPPTFLSQFFWIQSPSLPYCPFFAAVNTLFRLRGSVLSSGKLVTA
jgi:hypothetical protein